MVSLSEGWGSVALSLRVSGGAVGLAVSAQFMLSLHYLYLLHLSDVSTFCTDWGDSQGSTKINICREHKRGWVSSRKSVHGIKQDHATLLPSCP